MEDHSRGLRPALLTLCPPGLGRLLRRDAMEAGMRVGHVGNDGRADVVHVRASAWEDARRLRLAEVVCCEVGGLRLQPTLRATVAQIDHRRLTETIAHLQERGLLPRERRIRLVVRFRDERAYTRSALRDAIARQLRAPVVRGHEPAHELWVLDTARGRLDLGIRVRSLEVARVARPLERPGSLPPSIAAAMVMLAGPGQGRVLDPCCGSGTLLAVASRSGWTTLGGDLDEGACTAASANTNSAIVQLDARRLPFRDDEFDVVVSNLPFGHQHIVQGSPVAWYRKALREAIRVAPTAVLLAPPSAPFRQALGRLPVSLAGRHDVEVLGRTAAIWQLNRPERT